MIKRKIYAGNDTTGVSAGMLGYAGNTLAEVKELFAGHDYGSAERMSRLVMVLAESEERRFCCRPYEMLRRIALAYDYRKECVKKIKAMKVFIEEAKSKSDLRKAWVMRQSGTFPSLYSKKAGSSITLLIDADLESRKGLHYLHEIVIYHAKEEIKKNEEKIRRYKTTIKELSREFQKLREGF